ncbi:hypothetical protein BH18VER1_BH18VER1_22770 [soil metagenome]
MIGLLDTNVALYLLGGRLAAPLPAGDYGISVITEMELLAWPSLTADDKNQVMRKRLLPDQRDVHPRGAIPGPQRKPGTTSLPILGCGSMSWKGDSCAS